MNTIRTEPITDPSAWQGKDLEKDRQWDHTLTEVQREALEQALEEVGDVSLAELDLTAFQKPVLQDLMHKIKHELQYGRGIALLHGFPVENHSFEEIERMYWGLASHVGTGVTQNSQADLIHYVTDGKFRPHQGTRKVGAPGRVGLHVDLSDCVALLCVRQAPDDPPSRLASSMHIYNELLRHHPEALSWLYEGFQWDRKDEHGETESPTSGYRVPIFSQSEGVVSCRYNRNWITEATQRLGTSFTPEQNAIFDFMDNVATESCLEFPFHAGDIQFANNYTVLHGRAEHEEVPDEDKKRVLFRLWLDFPETRPFIDEGIVRYGVVRHGALGWSAEELRNNHHQTPRPRTESGVVLL